MIPRRRITTGTVALATTGQSALSLNERPGKNRASETLREIIKKRGRVEALSVPVALALERGKATHALANW